jgi:NAD(P)-dependent dehydrogenase (short-subunit alcohol dehydrogenase family)
MQLASKAPAAQRPQQRARSMRRSICRRADESRQSMRDLKDKVVVITGGSSGLGRAAAVQFAARGCIVIVAARRQRALEETVHMCRSKGGRAFHRVTDVTREEEVTSLVDFAASHTGRIDVWVNNAGVTLFGALDAGPFAEHRRVLETNLYGPMFAARALLPVFRRQKHGVMINVGSVLSKIGQPFVPSYVISKFALRGLSEALRAEVVTEPGIHICSLYPYAVNTEHFASGANHMGRAAHAMPPDQSPEKVARAMVQLAASPRRERHVPRSAVLGLAAHALMPRTVERVLHDALARWHFGNTPEADSPGNLYAPLQENGKVRGDHPPLLSAPRLVAWAAGRLLTLQVENATGWLSRLRARFTALPGRPLELDAAPLSAPGA